MTRSLLPRLALFVLLAAATLAAGTMGPLHALEALRGHEHCGEDGAREALRHICHDDDGCTVCGLLALPAASVEGESPAGVEVVAAGPVAVPEESPCGLTCPHLASARAPPAA